MKWHISSNNREMPWKGEIDAYKIWLSEIILQQTRVNQGLIYYNKFVQKFPNIEDLANASENEVFKLWAGLGYYTRCKNLITTAKYIVFEKNGIFPNSFSEILALKGIGNYTAAAIASFAFKLPYAVVDGNVNRVLARFFGLEYSTNTLNGKKNIAELAQLLLHKKQPNLYNQAIMDFGALVCKPKQPICNSCILKKECIAYIQNKVNILPFKIKPLVKKERWLNYFVINYKNNIYIQKRMAKDIWENLYEFILFETNGHESFEELKNNREWINLFKQNKFEIIKIVDLKPQLLSHQKIYFQIIEIEISKPLKNKKFTLISKLELVNFPFPKMLQNYLTTRIKK